MAAAPQGDKKREGESVYERRSKVTHLSLLELVLRSAKDIRAIKTDGKDLRERNEKVITVNLDI